MCSEIVVGKSEHYSENDGAYAYAYYLLQDGSVQRRGGRYDATFDAVRVNATEEQINQAVAWCRTNQLNFEKSQMIGCVVTLRRSRKAPNGVRMPVLNWSPRTWMGQYYQEEQICVGTPDGGRAWVSASAATVVEGRNPVWAQSSLG